MPSEVLDTMSTLTPPHEDHVSSAADEPEVPVAPAPSSVPTARHSKSLLLAAARKRIQELEAQLQATQRAVAETASEILKKKKKVPGRTFYEGTFSMYEARNPIPASEINMK
jgi:hypothetical protein